jgi:CheY-like chemotaxis protein
LLGLKDATYGPTTAVVIPLAIIVILGAAVAASLVYALKRRRPAAVAHVLPLAAERPSRAPAAVEIELPPVAVRPSPAPAAVENGTSPVAEQPSPAPAAVKIEPPVQHDGAAAGTVLLVEDDDNVRGSTVRILERAGFEVLEAKSAAAALNVWHGHEAPIDLVLSDVVMPGASGVELAAEIAALSPGAAIILISGFTPAALAHHRLLSGDDDGVQLLQKPLAPAELVAAVRSRILAGRPQAV